MIASISGLIIEEARDSKRLARWRGRYSRWDYVKTGLLSRRLLTWMFLLLSLLCRSCELAVLLLRVKSLEGV